MRGEWFIPAARKKDEIDRLVGGRAVGGDDRRAVAQKTGIERREGFPFGRSDPPQFPGERRSVERRNRDARKRAERRKLRGVVPVDRSEEHTSELQSRG